MKLRGQALHRGKEPLSPPPRSRHPHFGPGDTVVSDLSGTITTPGVNGECYAHLMLHRDLCISLLGFVVRKSEMPALVKEHLREVERQGGRPVKVFRPDRGGEYINFELKDWLLGNGI
jgi:hypothetical protein